MTGIIILAAGSSSRMGQPKQQLIYRQKTLLQHAVEVASGVNDSKVIVVLGANNQLIMPNVDSKIADIVINPDWEQGMASSIRSGITALQTLYPQAQSTLLMLCDQPFVSTELLKQLIETGGGNENSIVACTYQDTIGTPVLLGKQWFDDLLNLQGQEGAKKLLIKNREKVLIVPFSQGGIDIDTPEDYHHLLNR